MNNSDLEVKEKTGKFKPNKKFISFVSSTSSRVRFIRDTAFVDGSKLSGILDGTRFKITIFTDGTIDFKEVDTNKSDEPMIQRIIEDICDRNVTGYAEKFVVSNLEFRDVDNNLCYLEVEHQKPIEKLASLFQESEKRLSEKGSSVLDLLLSDEDLDSDDIDDIESENSDRDQDKQVQLEEKVTTQKSTLSHLEESFNKMNEAKIIELKDRISLKKEEISRLKLDIENSKSSIEKVKDDISVLETRLENLISNPEPNGYVFNVSEKIKSDIEIDDKTKEIVDKISEKISLKKELLLELLKGGDHIIKIAKKDDIESEPKDIDKEAISKIKDLNLFGSVTMTGNGVFKFRGELNWHQLVDKMIKYGFEQNEDFDKLCGSNSYKNSTSLESEKNL